MKRSDMIMFIEEVLIEFPEEIESAIAADRILKKIENMGMTPPGTKTTTKTGKERIKKGWEAEDEQT